MNLLGNRSICRLFKAKWFPVAAQWIMLAIFIALIVGGLGVTSDDPDHVQWLRNTNLANLIVWSYWWPVLIISAVLFGRVWCTVCPMELVTYWAGRIGLKLRVPRFLRSGWGVTLFYTLIWIVGMQTLGVNRIPHRMSLYMLFLILTAVDISLIFEKRAFCSHLCPVGHLLGLYALLSPFEWRAADGDVCQGCRTKDCIAKKNHYRLTGRSCTSGLYPAAIKDNRDCLLCTQCLKSCPHGNLRFSSRQPMADLLTTVDLRPAQAGFILMLGGFVVYEILSEWPVSHDLMMWLPGRLAGALGLTGTMSHLVSVTVMFVVLPVLVLWAVAALARSVSGGKAANFGSTAKTFTLFLLPTIASAHIIKSLLKASSRTPYWPLVLADPKGVEAARSLVAETLVVDKSLAIALDPVVTVLSIGLLVMSLVATVLMFRNVALGGKCSRGARGVQFLGVLAYWSVFSVMILKWRF